MGGVCRVPDRPYRARKWWASLSPGDARLFFRVLAQYRPFADALRDLLFVRVMERRDPNLAVPYHFEAQHVRPTSHGIVIDHCGAARTLWIGVIPALLYGKR